MTITVELTQADIGNAICHYFWNLSSSIYTCCPIAEALKRQFPGKHISVSLLGMRIGDTRYRVSGSDEERVIAVTSLSPSQWRLCNPVTFTITGI